MGAFFVGWELWEELTFVLACGVAFVFAFGLARLWWTNRRIASLELIDEERRVRLAEMRHCGIDARGITDIPFGVRALQSGIEVDGIWVSRSNTPATSRAASTTTLVDDLKASKGKGKLVEASVDLKKARHVSVEVVEHTSSSSPLTQATSGYSTPVPADEFDLNDGRKSYNPHDRNMHDRNPYETYILTKLRETQYQARSNYSSSANRASTASSMLDMTFNSNASANPINADAEESFFDAHQYPPQDHGSSGSVAEAADTAKQRSGTTKIEKKKTHRHGNS